MTGLPRALSPYFTTDQQFVENMVERFFRDLTQKRLRRRVFRDVEELIMPFAPTSTSTTAI